MDSVDPIIHEGCSTHLVELFYSPGSRLVVALVVTGCHDASVSYARPAYGNTDRNQASDYLNQYV